MEDLSPTIRKIKNPAAGESETRMMWMQSHIGIRGNNEADTLAELGEELPQDYVELVEEIVKARIRRAKWNVEHARAKAAYGDRRGKEEEEREWPVKIRMLYSKLMTGDCGVGGVPAQDRRGGECTLPEML